MVDSVGMSVLSACGVHSCTSHGQSFEYPSIPNAVSMPPSSNHPPRNKVPWSSFRIFVFVLGVEIDHDIAAEHEIERPESSHTFAQVDGFKTDHINAPDRPAARPCRSGESA